LDPDSSGFKTTVSSFDCRARAILVIMHAALFHLALVATATAADCRTGEQSCEASPPTATTGSVLLQQRIGKAMSFAAERTNRTEQVVRFHKGNHRAQNREDPCEVCTFNPAYVCLVSGSCWGYSNAASCQNAGGAFCQLPTCPEGQMVVDGKCIEKLNTEPERWVRVHNIFRCMHGSPAVSWNADAAANAQEWVNGLSSLQHSESYKIAPPAGPAGENLAMGQSSLEACTVAWYKEVKDCSWPGCQSSPTGAAVGHFTAVVWGATSEIGCAINSKNIYICRYLNQPGNYGGAYAANVAQVSKSFDTCVAEVQGSAPAPPAATPEPAPPTPAPPAATPVPAPPMPPAPPAPAPPASGCKDPNNWVGDKFCDAQLNTKECNWDGGDCGAAPAPAPGPTPPTAGGACAVLSGCEATLNDASSGCSFTISCSKASGWSYQFTRSFNGQQSWGYDYSSDGCLSCTIQVN